MSEAQALPGHSRYPVSTSDKKRAIGTRAARRRHSPLGAYHDAIFLQTKARLQFMDFTEQLVAVVRRSGIRTGFANVQTRHTTTAVMVNENEPLLQEDMRRVLERLAPHDLAYQHDDFSIRTVNVCADEEKNGHAHCKAMFLRASENLNVAQGELQLGRWQRVFLIELDRGKKRTVSVTVIGTGE
jgi:secondary thiamine-phosphate synthase enzyme